MPLSVKAVNLARFFPAWRVTRKQWADILMPSISGVAIDTLLLSRIGSPLCHQSDRKPRGFPGHVPTSSACLPRRIRLCGATPAPPSACSRTCLPISAADRQSGECATLICSRTPDCFSVTTTSLPERGYQFGWGPESICGLPAEMSSVQALMDLTLPRFAELADGPRQVHLLWSVASDSPASSAPARAETCGEEDSRCSMDQTSVSSTYLNLDAISSSSEEDSQDLAKT